MIDLFFVALVIAFFAVAAALVRGCEAMIGSDDARPVVPAPEDDR